MMLVLCDLVLFEGDICCMGNPDTRWGTMGVGNNVIGQGTTIHADHATKMVMPEQGVVSGMETTNP